jgi:hypothetical protein
VIPAALAFVWFLWHAPPGVDWLDAGELGAAAYGLGVSHPPGQPLHALLGKLATLLPLGEVAFRVSVLSALAGAICVWGTFALARVLLPKATWPAWVAALLVAASPLTLGQAARLEVYAPLAALTTWGALFAVRWLRGPRAPGDALAAAFAFALAAGLQPLSAIAVAAPLALLLAVRAPLSLSARALATGALGLAVYLYLPLRWLAEPTSVVLWSDRRGFFSFVAGTAYQQNFDLAGLLERLPGHLMLLGEGPGLALLVLGGAGLLFGALTGLRGAAPLLLTLPLVAATAAVQRVFHPANPDIHGYLLPVVPLLGAGAAAFLDATARALGAIGAAPGLLPLPGLTLVGFLVFAGPRVHVGDLGARGRDDARVFAAETAFRMPPGPALYLTTSDHALFPALYEQAVAGERPDVAVAGDLLLASSWHLASLARTSPELAYAPDPDRTVAAAPLAGGELPRARFPATPLGWGFLYAPVPGAPSPPPRFEGELGRRIAAFVAIDRRALWHELPKRAPIFVFEPWEWELVLRDLLYEAGLPRPPLAPDARFELRLLEAWHLALDGDLSGVSSLDPEARAATVQMLARRGLGAARRGDRARARELLDRSLALDPEQPAVREWRYRLDAPQR